MPAYASKAVESARVSDRWRVAPGEPIFVKRIRYDLDEWSDLPVPEGYRVDPFRDSGCPNASLPSCTDTVTA